MKRYVIVGASDQALVTVDVLDRRGELDQIVSILDASNDGSYVGRDVAGMAVSGTIADLGSLALRRALVVPAVGNPDVRRRINAAAQFHSLGLASVVDRTALVSNRAALLAGVFVGPGAIIGPGASVGAATIINSGAIVEHHVQVGPFCHVGPGATIAGNCVLEDGVTIGVGASVVDRVRIGRDATVGAGAAVVGDVPADSVVVGVPARMRED